MNYQDWVEWWQTLPMLKQWLIAGGFGFWLALLLLYWTPLGNRRAALKCAFLAVALHFLAWGGAAQFIGAGGALKPAETRIPIRTELKSTSSESLTRLTPNIKPPKEIIEAPRKAAVLPETLLPENKPVPIDLPKPKLELAKLEPSKPRPKLRSESVEPIPEIAPPPKATPKPSKVIPKSAEPTVVRKLDPKVELPVAKPLELPTLASTKVSTTEVSPRSNRAMPELPTELSEVPEPARTNQADKPARKSPARSAGANEPTLARSVESTPQQSTAEESPADVPALSFTTPGVMESSSQSATSTGRSAHQARSNLTDLALADISEPPPLPTARKPELGAMTKAEAEKQRSDTINRRSDVGRKELVNRLGGSAKTEEAVELALDWLARHQASDGRWSCTDFGRFCPPGEQCTGTAIEHNSDIGVTALSLLAFSGAGYTHFSEHKYGEVVRRGLNFILRQRDESTGSLMKNERIYSHAMATLAVLENYILTSDERLLPHARQAIRFLVEAQNRTDGGWRYVPGETGDMSVFGWVILAFHTAEKADIKVPAATMEGCRRFLAAHSRGQRNGLAVYQPDREPSRTMTAEALLCRFLMRESTTPETVNEGVDWILTRLPDAKDSQHGIYYWYYGTLAMFHVGGQPWERWNSQLVSTLLSMQEKKGHRAGSFPPQSPFGVDGGRVFSTAVSALCLEAYYRYEKLHEPANQPNP